MTRRKEQARTARRAAVASLAALVLLVATAPAPAGAQAAGARLRGVVFDSTVMEPLPGARVAVLGTRAITDADELGRFELTDIPAGSHWVSFYHPRLQALGVSAPSQQVVFEAGATASLQLAVPSERTLLMGWCMAEQEGPGHAALAGVVSDSLTGVPLAGALVTAAPLERGAGRTVEVRADDSGYYRICNAPAGRPLRVQAHFGRNSGRTVTMEIPEGDAAVRDLVLLMSAKGILVGKILDWTTGEPLDGAEVSVLGTDSRALTDVDGTFTLDDLPPGRHLVVTDYLGYEQRTDSVTIFSQETVNIEVRMATEALEVEGLVVTARTRFGRTNMFTGGRRSDVLTRAQIEPLLARVQNAGDLLRNMNAPGLSVREVQLADPVTGIMVPGICVEVSRRSGGSQGCMQAAVFVNDVLMPSGAEFLRDLDPNIIDHIEVLSPIDAQFRFGTVAGNGALAIYTR